MIELCEKKRPAKASHLLGRPNRNGSCGDRVMAKRQLPSQEVIRQLLDYDPETGRLFWRPRDASWFSTKGTGSQANAASWNKRWAGKEAFTADSGQGYRAGTLLMQREYAHRVIWRHVHGTVPALIDHINGNRSDNRISNLRETDQQGNMLNTSLRSDNKSGVPGVRQRQDTGRWTAKIKVAGRLLSLGCFDSFEQAVAARKSAELRYGFHRNHGRDHTTILNGIQREEAARAALKAADMTDRIGRKAA